MVNALIAESSFNIGALARATGTKVETVRWYEKVGLLPTPARSAGNYRTYGEAHLGRLSFIRRARELGFSLQQIRALLGLVG
ncbi:MerR family transcriptional regulator [Roseomonas ludipueritiae]|uniref:MerR family transcriptional regulator n=1 Tax=Pseudoroseomonas ludipueritiae TaxID=198093 RepID=A0ABR7R2I2_9PROT|nr:MerR family transcriptional regulator [Pseudoroseomonas ludipueritiae]